MINMVMTMTMRIMVMTKGDDNNDNDADDHGGAEKKTPGRIARGTTPNDILLQHIQKRTHTHLHRKACPEGWGNHSTFV